MNNEQISQYFRKQIKIKYHLTVPDKSEHNNFKFIFIQDTAYAIGNLNYKEYLYHIIRLAIL